MTKVGKYKNIILPLYNWKKLLHIYNNKIG